MEKYIVKDTTNHVLTSFSTYREAYGFTLLAGRTDWKIISSFSVKPTAKQIAAIGFCEAMLNKVFTGDMNDAYEVSTFLSKYLTEAKEKADSLHRSDYFY